MAVVMDAKAAKEAILSGTAPNGLTVSGQLALYDQPALEHLPEDLQVESLYLRNCPQLKTLPKGLRCAELEIEDIFITTLPADLQVTGNLSLGRWRGVPISGQVAFCPETLTAKAVLKERNAEIRRVMLERMGYERFVAQATTIHQDRDAGGARRLLSVPLEGDEPLVCLAVLDPSTGRQYLIRVPPTMQTCHQAAAWIAGFENPDDYHPIAETRGTIMPG